MATSFSKKVLQTALALSFFISPPLTKSGMVYAAATPAQAAFKFVKEDASSGLKEYRLNSNGLTILLQEKHSAPVVTVMVVYKVGSRNEAVGYTGSTHFLEHMMFKGTQKHDPLKGTGLDDLLKPVGGVNNATTSYDRTNYFEIVPSKDLAICLELEADRMRHALLRNTDRQSEMTVVRNELERGENSAANILDTQLFATAFREHPYHHPVIGWRSDVEGVPIERLRQFYNDFYYPNNATLLVMGDFKTPEALKQIEKYFAKVPASPKPFPKVYTVEPPQEGERRFVVQRGDEMPKILLGYHIPSAQNKDTYPLEVLSSILGDQHRQSSRLYKKLVDSGLASQAYAYNYAMRDAGIFTVYASASGNTKLETLEKAVEDELALLGKEPVSDSELDRAKKAVWKKLKLQQDDPMNFAQQLADAQGAADWKWLIDFEKNIKAVTAADVERVARKYFSAANRSVGYYLPKEKASKDASSASAGHTQLIEPALPSLKDPQEAAKPESIAMEPRNTLIAAAKPALLVSAVKESGAALIASKTKKKVLANGLTVYVLPVKGSGIVAVAGKFRGGEYGGDPKKTLLPELHGEMLNKGSRAMSKEQLADLMETMGSSFEPQTQTFWTEIESEVVTEDLDKFLEVVSESLREPAFKAEELEKLKKQKESQLKDAMVETGEVALNKALQELYKNGCVYHQRPFQEQIDELSQIKVEDLQEFHKKHFNASNAVFALVGDISPEQGFALAEKHFANWEKGSIEKIQVADCKCESASKKLVVSQIPDKANVDIIMAVPADISIKSKDFCAAQLANSALGHDTISSRLAVIREKYGLTYGVNSSFSEVAEPWAPWMIQLSVNPDNTNKALKLVHEIVSDYVKKGISPEELEMEKKRMSGEYVVYRMRTPSKLAEALTRYSMLGLGPDFMDRYPAMLQNARLEEVNAAIKKYMNPDRLFSSLAGSVPASVKSK
ncbi:MAG: insulinase family protein [Candidatus Obscuribacterales bacterium]|nr:insulinase family protein [Candidatus Obscuribacterales bacterium]